MEIKNIIEFIYCRGNDKSAPHLCEQAFVHYGSRSDNYIYAKPYMLDFPFHKSVEKFWNKHLLTCERWLPHLALVPDYFKIEDRGRLLKHIDDLQRLTINQIGVCPKFEGAIKNIPNECIICVSVPTSYAGFLPDRKELEGRKIHLLGGHPDQQKYLINVKYEGLNILSVDGNIAKLKAGFGQYWDTKWMYTKREFTREELIIKTLSRMNSYLSEPQKEFKMYNRIKILK